MRFRILIALLVLPLLTLAQVDFGKPVYLPGNSVPYQILPAKFDGKATEELLVTSLGLLGSPGSTPSLYQYDATLFRMTGPNKFAREDMQLWYGTPAFWEPTDVNSDGKADIILLDLVDADVGNRLVIKLSPSTIKSYNLPRGTGYWRGDVGDLDLDGKVDLVLAALGQPLHFFKGDGNGNFTLSLLDGIMQSITEDFALALRDVNGDQRPDLIFGHHGKVSIYTRKSPSTVYTKSEITFKGLLSSWGIADFSGDGRADIVVTKNDNQITKLLYYVNNGNGVFADSVALKETYRASFRISEVRDSDGDGKTDILLTTADNLIFIFEVPGSAYLLRNLGGENFEEKTIGMQSRGINVRFVNLDGIAPLEIVASSGSSLDFYRDNGSGYATAERVVLSSRLITVSVSDLDKDGYKDIIAAATYGRSLAIWYGKKNSEFESPVYYPAGEGLREDLQIADFNKDGFPDIAYCAASFGGGGDTPGALIMFSKGARSYDPPKAYPSATVTVLAADVDNDGDVDLITTSHVFKNDGTGKLTYFSAHSFQDYPSPAVTGHFNGDAFVDMAVMLQNKLYISVNDGTGALLEMKEVTSAGKINVFKSVNLNGDKHTDLLGLRYIDENNTTEVAALTSNGSSGFSEAKVTVHSGANAGLGGIADIDKDGVLDIAVGYMENSTNTYGVRVYPGKAGGGYGEPQFISTASGDGRIQRGTSIVLDDLNGDSKPDIIGVSTDFYPLIVVLSGVNKPTSSLAVESVIAEAKTAYITYPGNNTSGKLVVVRKDPGANAELTDGTFYKVDRTYGSGAKIGDGYVVKQGYTNSLGLLNLEPDTKYVIQTFLFEANEKNTVIKYSATPTLASFTTKRLQTITFADIPDTIFGTGNATVTATSSAGLPVTVFLMSGNGTFEDGVFKPAAIGQVRVRGFAAGNNVYASAAAEIMFCFGPKQPTITISKPAPLKYTLTSSADSANLWFINYEPIIGANGKTYEVTEDGVYNVAVLLNGCATESDPTDLLITGLEDLDPNSMKLWPNPAESFVRISNPTSTEPIFYNGIGVSYRPPYKSFNDEIEVNIETLPPGLYVVKIGDTKLKIIKK